MGNVLMAEVATPHRETLTYRPSMRPLSAEEVRQQAAAREFERATWAHEKLKQDTAAHRMAPSHRAQRLSSWAADKSPAQQDFETRKTKQAKKKGVSVTERMSNDRLNYHDKKKLE